MPPSPTNRRLLLAGWFAGLAATFAVLAGVGGHLPPFAIDPAGFRVAIDQHGVAMVALAVLRPVAMTVIAYQFVVTTLSLLGEVTSSVGLQRATRRASTGVGHRLVRHAIGAGLTATAMTALAPTGAFADTPAPHASEPAASTDEAAVPPAPTAPDPSAPDPGTAPVTAPIGEPIFMVRLPAGDPRAAEADAPDMAPDMAPRESSGGTSALMVALDPIDHRLGPDAPDGPAPPDRPDGVDRESQVEAASESGGDRNEAVVAPSPTDESEGPVADRAGTADTDPATLTSLDLDLDEQAEGAATDDAPDEDNRTEDAWVIQAGDHLWAIAAETLADEWGHPPTDDDVLSYWASLVAANHDRLADPSNPDLIFPGQVLVLPPAPAAVSGG